MGFQGLLDADPDLVRPTMRTALLGLPFLLVAIAVSVAAAEDTPPTAAASSSAPVDYLRDVEPILRTHCYGCHSQGNADAGLALDRLEDARRGGFSGGRILGGKLSENELWNRVAHARSRLPHAEEREGHASRDRDLDIIKRWIEQGSPWDDCRGPDTFNDEDLADFGPGIRDVANDMLNRLRMGPACALRVAAGRVPCA